MSLIVDTMVPPDRVDRGGEALVFGSEMRVSVV